jgi:hypothetical protein
MLVAIGFFAVAVIAVLVALVWVWVNRNKKPPRPGNARPTLH